MSRKLAALLGKPETVVSAVIRKLEHVSGFQSNDVSLLSDVHLSARSKMVSLSLDPDDTTPRELHHALLGRYRQDEKRLASKIGLNQEAVDSYNYVQKILELTAHADVSKEVWALKRTVAKDILRRNPPRQLVKKLNYRSADSMLKRENVSELCAAVPFTESERWLKSFYKAISKTKPTDFESRTVETTLLNPKYLDIQKAHKLATVSNVPYLGSVIIWSSDNAARLGVIGLSLTILDSVNDIKVYSAFAKLHQVEVNFGVRIVEMLHEGVKAPIEFVKTPVSWTSLFHNFGKLSGDDFSEMFGPHLAYEDTKLTNSLNALIPLSPSLEWWSELEHIGAELNGKVVSFNIKDVINNHLSGARYSPSSTSHLGSSLWHELIGKYLTHPGTQGLVLAKASESQWQPEAIQKEKSVSQSDIEVELSSREFAGIA